MRHDHEFEPSEDRDDDELDRELELELDTSDDPDDLDLGLDLDLEGDNGDDSDLEFDPEDGFEDPDELGEEPIRWPMSWQALFPRERWSWFQRLWEDVCRLRVRYQLPVRARWWEDGVQVEALAALSAWVDRYDSGEWDDPPGKLSLLLELQQLEPLLRDGHEPLHPDRDRPAFERYLAQIGCEPPRVGAG